MEPGGHDIQKMEVNMEKLLRWRKKIKDVTIARVYFSVDELRAFVKKEGSLC